MLEFFILWGCVAMANIAWVLPNVVAGRILACPAEEVLIFMGPTIYRGQVGQTWVSLKCIPLGSSVKFPKDQMNQMRFIAFSIICCSGFLGYIIPAVILLPWPESLDIFLGTFSQTVEGGLHPLSVGKTLVRDAFFYIRQHDIFTVMGATLAKILAFNLLPFPFMSVGLMVMELAKRYGGLSESAQNRVMVVGFLAYLAFFVSWLLALGAGFWLFLHG